MSSVSDPSHPPGSPPGSARHPGMSPANRDPKEPFYVVLTGNPNSGKTTVFNALTGLRAKVANYAGVTVERKEGRMQGVPEELRIRVLDLPGTYSLSPQSLDERISRDVLFNQLEELPAPGLVVVVVDASNLQRNLYYATQVIELGHPTVVALNMVDVAEANGVQIDDRRLAEALGVKVIPVVASTGKGVPELRQTIQSAVRERPMGADRLLLELPTPLRQATRTLAQQLAAVGGPRKVAPEAEALLMLSNEKALASNPERYPGEVHEMVKHLRGRLEAAQVDWHSAAIEGRYAAVSAIQEQVSQGVAQGETFSDKLDRVLTHRVWGTLIFLAVMALLFQSIFTLARGPMEALQAGTDWAAGWVAGVMPPGDLNSLLVDGVIAGVGAVIIFLPQILLLFLFIGFLEDTGYMARAAFLMDRIMGKVGLHGKSFIPLVSSFACAIPGIMATRTIENHKDRLATILIAPLMGCSARLPVYTLLIAACIPDVRVLGFLGLPGLTLLGMYMLGAGVALGMAWLFKRTLLKGEPPLLIIELPPYRLPLAKTVLRHMWDRSKVFLRRAGTVILGINILLWALASYPRLEGPPAGGAEGAVQAFAGEEEDSLALRHSMAGRLGRLIEPVIEPLGFDWKIGIGIVMSFAAREVFVSTMSTVYSVSENGDVTEGLAQVFKQQTRADGRPMYTPLLGVTLMVFYVFALQCVSTVAIVRRETNSWKWPIFQWFYMAVLAWGFAFLTWRVGLWLGYS